MSFLSIHLYQITEPLLVTISGSGLEVRGAVFWVVLSGIVEIVALLNGLLFTPNYLTTSSGLTYSIGGLVVGLIYFALAYVCQREKGWGFLASIAVSAFVVVGAISISGLTAPISLEDALVVVVGLLTIYFSYMGYLKVRVASPHTSG